MGSSSSKDALASTSGGVRPRRSRRPRVFQPSCLSRSSVSSDNDDQISVPRNKTKNGLKKEIYKDESRVESLHANHDCSNIINASCSNSEFDQCSRESDSHFDNVGESSSTHIVSIQSPKPLRRSRSRFSFIPNNISFRLRRAASLGSSTSLFSTNVSVSNLEAELPANTRDSLGSRDRNETHPYDSHIAFPHDSLSNTTQCECSSSATSCVEHPLHGLSASLHVEELPVSSISMHLQSDNVAASPGTAQIGSSTIDASFSQRNDTEVSNIETRHFDRQIVQEPIGGLRFSRAMGVGRLRDRVLRRSSLSDTSGHHHDGSMVRDSRQVDERAIFHGMTRTQTSDRNSDMHSPTSGQHISNVLASFNGIQDDEVDGVQLREVNSHALLEQRTAFLERRRRIRSQFRALQRLGSRFENLSGHDRTCILSGHHRTGRCTCRANIRAVGEDEDTSARASISRIVMLAEALFEVLDEIHQQSVVLSSRPSVSSIGSIPAPKEIVDCLPVTEYKKPTKQHNEDAPQCYICLAEYEEADCLRVLPCHHDFHQACIDKWLKEIHRVCPLCRGDVCQRDLQHMDKFN